MEGAARRCGGGGRSWLVFTGTEDRTSYELKMLKKLKTLRGGRKGLDL